mmetsp:Transcript_8566/g.14232  ORF Transcript_8566/g.14232 Transcript_8566/m.14232 type:complete len:476 (+) Transcript_8566:118-1545(+)|eukprot:CAMPEP_0119021600 /NCGR_PEP_ID=MMETSP1176-20130426/26307_1 /TAXON_ID=265551 /ORGANISM="Synedropsis recta cf, Strain CCMP1620" /LENGTH=475 /DNA_ID=CAMNT_0006976239 /DNA_START=79 /DNA_END=1506 /DNA_ORIENTATION=+
MGGTKRKTSDDKGSEENARSRLAPSLSLEVEATGINMNSTNDNLYETSQTIDDGICGTHTVLIDNPVGMLLSIKKEEGSDGSETTEDSKIDESSLATQEPMDKPTRRQYYAPQNVQSTPLDDTASVDTIPVDTPAAPVITPEVKKELIRTVQIEQRNTYRLYGDRFLLLRHGKKGIAKLGGNHQETNPYPAKGNPNIWDEGHNLRPYYPLPKHINPAAFAAYSADDDMNMIDFMYLCFNDIWQPSAPQYAAQPSAAVDYFPDFHQENALALPIFVRRSRTSKAARGSGKLLGWEYVGNYKAVKTCNDDGSSFSYWESAYNLSEATKAMIAMKVFNSSKSIKNNSYGRMELNKWRKKLTNEIRIDPTPAGLQHMIEMRQPTEGERKNKRPPLAARARALGFMPKMPDEALSKLLVELDEYHERISMKFVEYDERIYEYCKMGKTNKTRAGKQIRPGDAGESAKAIDWYNFHDQQVT